MEKPLLRDPQIIPTSEVIETVLGDSYWLFAELMRIISDDKYGLVVSWNYYKDGNAWLCKVVYKKKTVFWLSAWDKFFKTSFYFTEKNCSGLFDLGIEQSIIDDFNSQKPIGKLLPLVMNIDSEDQLKHLLAVVRYKMSLK